MELAAGARGQIPGLTGRAGPGRGLPSRAMQNDPPELTLTGERTLPGIVEENYWFQRHVVAYRFAAARAAGRSVLDAGCGEGYGLAILAEAGATRVVGADLDETVITHVRASYATDNARIEAVACELMSLPIDDASIDLVVSLQVIEHVHDVPGYLASLGRVTRAGGEILIATPNRLTFTPDSDTPTNPFHVREFTAGELTQVLEEAGFEVTLMLGIRHGRALRTLERAVRRGLPELLARPAADWPAWTRRLVSRARPAWFELHRHDLDSTLDLLAVARRPLPST